MAERKKVLVIGGGFSGITTAIETAEAGFEVILVEKTPFLGGKVSQLNKYFPKLCPPNCGLEINYKRIKNNPNINIVTFAEVEKISGEEGNFNISIKVKPRLVNEKCTGCNACTEVCPVEMPNEFNFGMDKIKAAYIPHNQVFPFMYHIDKNHCKGASCNKCVDACKYNAIELEMKEKTVDVNVGSVVFATGWDVYNVANLDSLGAGKMANVVTNMQMERLASPSGPTKGKIQRLSDGKEIKNIAFVQCAGSRDENHLSYCSYICCMASLKQATYIREQYPDAQVKIFYIDMRTPGRYESFYKKVKEDAKVSFVKGKVGKLEQDKSTGDVIVTAEDAISGRKIVEKFDMVVLATGMVPATKEKKITNEIKYTDDGFVVASSLKKGMQAVGTLKSPVDVARSVQDATGAAIKNIQSARR